MTASIGAINDSQSALYHNGVPVIIYNETGIVTGGGSGSGGGAPAVHTHSISDLTGVAPSVHTHPWSQITGTPTTLAGYGITDGASPAGSFSVIETGTIDFPTWDSAPTGTVYSWEITSRTGKFVTVSVNWTWHMFSFNHDRIYYNANPRLMQMKPNSSFNSKVYMDLEYLDAPGTAVRIGNFTWTVWG